MNWFASIGQASSGLAAARNGPSVVSQNIENADTDGHTRQATQTALVAPVSTGLVYTAPTRDSALCGVRDTATQRRDDPVLDARVRDDHARAAIADASASTVSDIENTLNEPSSSGLSAQLSRFWTAWESVANEPGSTAARSLLLRSAQTVATTLNGLCASFAEVATSASDALDTDLAQANSAAQRLATLNGQIAIASATEQDVKALLDSRDQLMRNLSALVGGVATIGANGAAVVTVAGQTLVSGVTAGTVSVDAAYQVQVDGTAVSLSDGRAAVVFALLSGISAALRGSPSTLSSATLSDLDAALSQIGTAQAGEGATYVQVQQAQAARTVTGTAVTTQLSDLEDVDLGEMAIKAQTANTAYQAALQTTASIRQLSLLDFLR